MVFSWTLEVIMHSAENAGMVPMSVGIFDLYIVLTLMLHTLSSSYKSHAYLIFFQ